MQDEVKQIGDSRRGRLVPIAKAPGYGAPLDRKTLEWVSFWREVNGSEAAGAIIKAGGRIFVDLEKLDAWLRTSPRFSPPGVRRRKAEKRKEATGREAPRNERGQIQPISSKVDEPARLRKARRGAA